MLAVRVQLGRLVLCNFAAGILPAEEADDDEQDEAILLFGFHTERASDAEPLDEDDEGGDAHGPWART